ncbi:MAG: outer membrane protein assembly factor BamE [Legionellaceae bacterium]|nr:outer membrane protein assembly factor BamE [Legionellaceae bacterium]
MANFFMIGKNMRTFLKCIILTLCFFSLTHCASYDFSKRIVQQGNLLPEEKVKQVKRGMTKNEVAVLMGTSLLSPTFNNDRWDYAYTWRKGSGSDTVRRLSIYFKHDHVTRIET